MSKEERKRGATGYVLDADKLTKVLRQVTGVENAQAWGNPVLVYGEGESWAVVNTEGVGGVADNYDKPARVWWDRATAEGFWDARLSDDLVPFNDIQSCVTGKSVDLADHIRTFGSRLENNYAIWYEFVDKDLAAV